MVETLYVITPVTRAGNLQRIAITIASLRKWFRVRWEVVFSDRLHPDWWGGWERNEALRGIPDHAWVWFLDDDNVVHPDFAAALAGAIARYPDAAGFVFDQILTNGSLRLAATASPVCGEIDTAMFVLRRGAISNARWGDGYTTDWAFFRTVIDRLGPGQVIAVPGTQVYYNALEGVMRCRLCHSAELTRLTFELPANCPAWFRCGACGSDTADEGYNPAWYGPTSSLDHVRHTGGIERCREQVRSNCEWFGHHHQLGSDRTFLDVGCGDGAALDVMQSLNWSVHGFDVARPHYFGPHVTVAPCFHRWLFPRRYAAVLCREVLEHVECPDLLLHELHGVCVPGGLVQVQTPIPVEYAHPIPHHPQHLFLASPRRLREMLRTAMLDVIDERHWEIGQAYLCRARR
jgi:Methyltransferase domain